LIADEEVGADPDIGIEGLQKNGHLELLKGGPVYFLDCADKMPCKKKKKKRKMWFGVVVRRDVNAMI